MNIGMLFVDPTRIILLSVCHVASVVVVFNCVFSILLLFTAACSSKAVSNLDAEIVTLLLLVAAAAAD